MDFGSALTALKSGAQVYRVGWNGGVCITLNDQALYSGRKTAPPVDFIHPWYPSHVDLLASDWELV